MLKVTGAAVLVLAFAAAAQAGGGSNAHFTSSPSQYMQYGGGIGGGSSTGSSGATLQVPPTQFAVRAVSGSASDYVPSTFVSYESAVAEGDAALAANSQPLGTSAQGSTKPAAKNVKAQIVQKQGGDVTIQKR
jgi:hypothetical protein